MQDPGGGEQGGCEPDPLGGPLGSWQPAPSCSDWFSGCLVSCCLQLIDPGYSLSTLGQNREQVLEQSPWEKEAKVQARQTPPHTHTQGHYAGTGRGQGQQQGEKGPVSLTELCVLLSVKLTRMRNHVLHRANVCPQRPLGKPLPRAGPLVSGLHLRG